MKSSFDSAVSKAEQKLQVSGDDKDGGCGDDGSRNKKGAMW